MQQKYSSVAVLISHIITFKNMCKILAIYNNYSSILDPQFIPYFVIETIAIFTWQDCDCFFIQKQ